MCIARAVPIYLARLESDSSSRRHTGKMPSSCLYELLNIMRFFANRMELHRHLPSGTKPLTLDSLENTYRGVRGPILTKEMIAPKLA